MERAGETVNSPFGAFHVGWSAVLGGAMLQPSGPLNAYAFHTTISYNETTAASPDEAVLHRLAPVAVALERNGVNPNEFAQLSLAERAAKVEEILPESAGLVAGYLEQIRARAGALKPDEKEDALSAEILDVPNYLRYIDEKGAVTYRGIYETIRSHRARRIIDESESAAKSLDDRLPDAGSPQPVAPSSAPRRVDARLAEIRVLSGQIERQMGSVARAAAVARAFRLAAETDQPNEAAQKAAVRLLITAAEEESRDFQTSSLPKTKEVVSIIGRIGLIATKSPYASVQRLAVNNLMDNDIDGMTRTLANYRYRIQSPDDDYQVQSAAIDEVSKIAAASQNRELREEAISLLLREFETGSYESVKEKVLDAIDAVKAGMDSEPQIAKAPRKQASFPHLPLAIGSTGAGFSGMLGLMQAFLTLNAPLAIVAGIVIFASAIVFFMALSKTPWYRKDE